MSPDAKDWLARAQQALASAELLVSTDSDAAASRAYYAAFYAASALLAAEGKWFRKHSGVETAVHRDLVHTGRWSAGMGESYSRLQGWRITGDYGGEQHVEPAEAQEALTAARQIVRSVTEALNQG